MNRHIHNVLVFAVSLCLLSSCMPFWTYMGNKNPVPAFEKKNELKASLGTTTVNNFQLDAGWSASNHIGLTTQGMYRTDNAWMAEAGVCYFVYTNKESRTTFETIASFGFAQISQDSIHHYEYYDGRYGIEASY